jgi:hypothetical protein
VMCSLGLMLGREQIAAALRQRGAMAAALFGAWSWYGVGLALRAAVRHQGSRRGGHPAHGNLTRCTDCAAPSHRGRPPFGVGAACAGRNAPMRPAAAVAAAMRNPGLAFLIATVNKMSPGVAAAAFAYTLGGTLVVTALVVWRGRRAR